MNNENVPCDACKTTEGVFRLVRNDGFTLCHDCGTRYQEESPELIPAADVTWKEIEHE